MEALSIDKTSLSFTSIQGGLSGPASQVVMATVNARDAYYVVVGIPPGAEPATWLDVWLGGTVPTVAVNVMASPIGLSVGVYTATLRIVVARRDQAIIAYRDVSVTYTLRPGIALSPASLAFSHTLGSNLGPPSQNAYVLGSSGATWTASSTAAWVSLGIASGTAPATVPVAVDPSGLDLGTYEATVSFEGSAETPTLPITLTVVPPTLSVSPIATLGGTSGHDMSGQQTQLRLNTGSSPYPWTATAAPNWVSLSATAGTVSAAPATITVTPEPAGLAAGTYSGAVTFSAEVAGQTLTTSLPVTLNLDEHRLIASDHGVALSSAPGIAKLTRTLRIRSNHGVAVAWTASSDAPWLVVTGSGTTPCDLVLTATPGSLGADTTHYATVTIRSDDPTVTAEETVRVGLWVGSSAPAATTTVASAFAELAADPVRPLVYANARGTDVSVYNIFTGAQVATIGGVGVVLGAMAVATDGSRLFVVDDSSKSIVPVDLDALSVGTAWPLSAGSTATRHYLATTRVQGVELALASDSCAYGAATGAPFVGTFPGGPIVAASRQGSRVCRLDTGFSPYTLKCYPLDIDVSAGRLLVGAAQSPAWGSGGNGKDVALSADGSQVYVASGSPYSFAVFDAASTATTLPLLRTLPGDAYPQNVEVGGDGRIFGGSSVTYGPKDVWVYSPSGTLLLDLSVGSALSRQLVVSGDGLRMAVLTASALKLVTVGP